MSEEGFEPDPEDTSEMPDSPRPDWIWPARVMFTVKRHGMLFAHQVVFPLFTSN